MMNTHGGAADPFLPPAVCRLGDLDLDLLVGDLDWDLCEELPLLGEDDDLDEGILLCKLLSLIWASGGQSGIFLSVSLQS